LDNANNWEDNWKADDESDLEQANVIEDPETPAQQNVSATPHVRRLIRPSRKSKKWSEMIIITVSVMKPRRNTGNSTM
jgi:hypothetical protein